MIRLFIFFKYVEDLKKVLKHRTQKDNLVLDGEMERERGARDLDKSWGTFVHISLAPTYLLEVTCPSHGWVS